MKKKLLEAASTVRRIPIPKQLRGVEIASVIREPGGDVLYLIEATAGRGRSDNPILSWGRILVDLANHVAQSLTGHLQNPDGDLVTRVEVLDWLRQAIDVEWDDRVDANKELRRFTRGNEDDEPS